MCNPAAMGVGAMAMGTVLQQKAQKSQDRARSRALKAERERQDVISKQAQARFADELADFSGTSSQAKTDARQAEQDAFIADATASFDGSDLGPSLGLKNNLGADKAVQDQIVAGLAEGQERASQKSAFDAYGRASTDINRSLRKTNSDLANLAGFAQGSANVLPFELQAANQKGRAMATIGQLMGSVGSATAMYSGNQAAPAAAPAGAGVGP